MIRSDGNGNLIVKKTVALWTALITLTLLIGSLGYNVAYTVGLSSVKEQTVKNEANIEILKDCFTNFREEFIEMRTEMRIYFNDTKPGH